MSNLEISHVTQTVSLRHHETAETLDKLTVTPPLPPFVKGDEVVGERSEP